MIIRPSDICVDFDKAKLAAMQTASDLGVVCDCKLSSMWRVEIDGDELQTFLQLAKELCN